MCFHETPPMHPTASKFRPPSPSFGVQAAIQKSNRALPAVSTGHAGTISCVVFSIREALIRGGRECHGTLRLYGFGWDLFLCAA